MARKLQLSDRDFKTTMIYMLSPLILKVDNMQEQMGDASREMEILREN